MILANDVSPNTEPNWKPLEAAIGQKCVNYMYIAGFQLEDGVVVHAYKHINTREYINLSDDGRSWVFTGDRYREARESAVTQA